LTPFGVVRLLLRLRAFSLYPEQAAFEAQLTPDQRRALHKSVRRNVGPRGGTGREVRAVLRGARDAQRRMGGVVHPQFGYLPLAVPIGRVWGAKWVEMQRDLAARSSRSRHRVFDDRCHNVHVQHPGAVLEAVSGVLTAGGSCQS
jgi:hypothetical protein